MTLLPIDYKKDEIVETVKNNAVTIIEGNTGCGKTTRVPMYLMEAGYRLIVTQPRRLATIASAKTIAETLDNISLGKDVGYHTGISSKFSKDSTITFMTEGTELIRTLAGIESFENTVLVIDEAHEGGNYLETLIAFSKKLLLSQPELKVVLMSATLETKQLSEFFFNAPIITVSDVSGSSYNITKIYEPAYKLKDIVVSLGRIKENTLVFLPGKQEITRMEKFLRKKFEASDIKVDICPLHAEMTEAEQKEALTPKLGYSKIILATDIAQTSITPMISTVVDCGLAREKQLINGMSTLVTRHASQAECLQRAGRTGRLGDGIYYLCSNIKFDRRPPFPSTEIQYGQLDNILLRLIYFDIHIEELEFFHQPLKDNICHALKTLRLLDAIDENNCITEIGKEMHKLALEPRYARMVIEARKYKVEYDALICALISQIGYISSVNEYTSFNSDLFSQLATFKAIDPNHISSNINVVTYIHIKEYINKNLPLLKNQSSTKSINTNALKHCIAKAFPDQLYILKKFSYKNSLDGTKTHLYKNSSLFKKDHKFLVGSSLNFKDFDGSYSRIIIPTALSLKEVLEYFSDLLEISYSFGEENDIFNTIYNNNKIYKVLLYNGIEVTRFKLGTVEELKLSNPEGFHSKEEIDTKYNQKFLTTYYYNLKISSRLLLS